MEALIARAAQFLIALGGAYILALWFALIVWTFQDIQRRSRSVIAQIFSTLVVVLFFVFGILIYLLLRPRDTLDESFQRSLEEEYLLQDLEELPLCPNCQRYVEDEFVFCPHCRIELRQACASCDQLIDLRWEICPYCGLEQYPDEAEALAPEWDRAQPAMVDRLVQGARARLPGRWSRLPEDDTLPADVPAVGAWNPGRESASWRSERTQDGNGVGPGETHWDDQDESSAASAMERTDELPAGTTRPRS